MSTKKLKKETRLVYFISDFIQPWIVRHIEDRALRGKLVQLLGSMKQAIYNSEDWRKWK